MGREFFSVTPSPSQQGAMVRLGMGHPFKTLLFQPLKTVKTHTHIYIYILYSIYPDYHKIRISEQGGLIGGSHMFIHREGPSQSSVAKHFWECGS